MGKLYDEIAYDIKRVQEADKEGNIKELVNANMAAGRICNLLNEIEKKCSDLKIEYKKIDLNDLDKLESKLNDIEKTLENNGNAVKDIINSSKKFETLDFRGINLDNMKELEAYATIYSRTIDSIRVTESFNLKNYPNLELASPKELILAAKNEAEYILEMNKDDDNKDKYVQVEYKKTQQFIKDPAKTIFEMAGKKPLINFSNEEEKNAFINDIDSSVQNEIAEKEEKNIGYNFNLKDAILKSYLDIEVPNPDDTIKLAPAIRKNIMNYYESLTGANEKIIKSKKDIPTMGEYLYALREKVSSIVIDNKIELGVEKNLEFVKSFLDDPISCMDKYYEDRIEDYEAAEIIKKTTLISKYDNVDFDKLIPKTKKIKAMVLESKASYEKEKAGKKDAWTDRKNYHEALFERHFKKNMDVVINDALANNKGGFFENLFGTTSKEYKDFSHRLEVSTQNGALKGDLDGLKQSAQIYLAHKLKSYNMLSADYDEAEILKLDATSRSRVYLALGVCDSVDDTIESAEENLNPNDISLSSSSYDIFDEVSKSNSKNNDLAKFQNDINNDIEKDINKEEADLDISDYYLFDKTL